MDQIDRVDSSEKNKEDASVSYTTHEDYYLDSNYTLWVNMGNTSPKTTYQMVVILPQNVGTDWNSTDLYVQANTLLNFVYSMRYTALVTMFVSVAGCFCSGGCAGRGICFLCGSDIPDKCRCCVSAVYLICYCSCNPLHGMAVVTVFIKFFRAGKIGKMVEKYTDLQNLKLV